MHDDDILSEQSSCHKIFFSHFYLFLTRTYSTSNANYYKIIFVCGEEKKNCLCKYAFHVIISSCFGCVSLQMYVYEEEKLLNAKINYFSSTHTHTLFSDFSSFISHFIIIIMEKYLEFVCDFDIFIIIIIMKYT